MSDVPEYKGYDPRKAKGVRKELGDLITEFATERPPGTLALNLGSGDRPIEGYTNVDAVDMENVDEVVDLYKFPWPWPDNSVSVIYSSHFMEHVPDWKAVWNEIWRVSTDEARIIVRGPWFNSDWHEGDPDHKQKLLDRKFLYFSKEWRADNLINHYWPGPDINIITEFNPWRSWHPDFRHIKDDNDPAKHYHMTHTYNAILECIWFLKAFKTEASYKAYQDRIAREAQA